VNDRRRRIAEEACTREDAGLPGEGFVFCCFNNSYKIIPRMFDVWMRLLTGVPGSVLWLVEDSAAARRNLEKEARALEQKRDHKSNEADLLLHRHHGFAYAVTLFQVAIALGAVSALTQARSIWIGSMSIGLGGIALFVIYFFN